ncbi:MAG: hypothetical protein WC488_04555 [Candidatus Micrarchaeia archaeon]
MGFDFLKAVGAGVLAAIAGVFVAMVGILAIFIFAILGAVMGAIGGWIVSIAPIIGPLVKEGFMAFGVANPNLVAIGAMLGFIAGFFKSNFGGHKCE